MPMMNALKNVMLNEEVDIKVINYLKSFVKSMGFTDTLFVSVAGDNSDGSSWEKAYTSLTTALDWVQANQATGENHLIMSGVGTFDIDTTGDPTYSCNVSIVGSGKFTTIITNTHASATSVLKLTGSSSVYSLTITCGISAVNGLIIDGTGASGFICHSIYLDGETVTGAQKLITISGGVRNAHFLDCRFYGVAAHTTAIYVYGATECRFEIMMLNTCLKGIHLNHADSDFNEFIDITIINSAIGIDLDIGNQQSFRNLTFLNNTRNVDDEVGDSIFAEIKIDEPFSAISPNDLVGITLTGNVAADTYGVDTEICSAASRNNPFVVVAIMFEFSVVENCGLRLSANGGTGYFFESVVECWAINEIHRIEMDLNYPQVFNKGTRISGSFKSASGGDSAKVWLQIKEL